MGWDGVNQEVLAPDVEVPADLWMVEHIFFRLVDDEGLVLSIAFVY